MNSHPTAALAAARLQNLPLPLNVPRPAWPGLIDHAAEALSGRSIHDSETLARELAAIAAAMRAEVRA